MMSDADVYRAQYGSYTANSSSYCSILVNEFVDANNKRTMGLPKGAQVCMFARTFSMNGTPHDWSLGDNSAILSSLMRNLRWKLRSLFKPGNRRWRVS